MSSNPQNTRFRDLLRLRYGASIPEALVNFDLANSTLESIFNHKSVRSFKDEPLPVGTVEALAAAGQSAATSSNLQAWSLIALQDTAHKNEAAILCGNQDSIRQAPLFFVFCADLARLNWVSEQEGLLGEALDYFEMFLIAALDAALAAQNIAVAAESLGLGICYIGAARNKPRELAELLKLPHRTIALFGMTVGWPQEDLTTTAKPRLPQPGLLHYETYHAENWADSIATYNQTMQQFYDEQRLNTHQSWSQSSAKRVASKEALTGRDVLRQILEERGFGLK